MALPASSIVNYALQIAKAPKFIVQAGDFLNALLNDLAATYDFEVLRKYATVPISANGGNGQNTGFYILPPDFARVKEVFYNTSGTIFFLYAVALEEYDSFFQGPGIADFPYAYALDMSPPGAAAEFIGAPIPQMAFYPPPNIPLTIQIRYYFIPPDIATPQTSSTVPWFPNSRYLITRLASEVMKITDDERRPDFLKEAEDILRRYLEMQQGQEGAPITVQLDRRLFRSFANLKPTKLTGF